VEEVEEEVIPSPRSTRHYLCTPVLHTLCTSAVVE